MRKHSTINHFLVILFSTLLCIPGYEVKGQLSYNVLFLGNSYTGMNNLPQLVHDVALSAGDTLVFDSHAPGGAQLIDHSVDATSQNKIMAGGWNYVVIQGQSQEPITLSGQFSSGGTALYNLVKQYNSCAVVMPYMTWGRKNGDAAHCPAFPVMCTYQGMDSALRRQYLTLTSIINGEVSPVSVVWKYLRQNHPNIELYLADESHPSTAGSYAAACCFYASLFKKDPTLITFNFGLSAGDASIIRNAVKTQVYDSLQLWDFKRLPISHFRYQAGAGVNQLNFFPNNQGVRQNYAWAFGDGNTSTTPNPTHTYAANGSYTVSLTTTTCDLQGLHSSTSDTVIQFCSHTPTVYTSHPWMCKYDTLWTELADAYQWFKYEVPLPETRQYLPDYARYNMSGFAVVSTVNGCSELSKLYTQTPQSSGYYFDVMGNPCNGNTVAFAVLHTSGSLSGSENIQWFKNDTLLSAMANEDTLLITAPGIYECKVIDPGTNCPLDTTSYRITYDCGVVVGIEELLSFNGRRTSNSIHLYWFTSNEFSLKAFIVEQSSNGRDFSKAGEVIAKGHGNNNYVYDILNPVKANLFFRLKILDKDGSFNYSRTVLIKEKSKAGFVVQPNPVKERVSLNNIAPSLLNTEAVIINSMSVAVKRFVIRGASQSVEVNELAPGIYYLKTSLGSEKIIITR